MPDPQMQNGASAARKDAPQRHRDTEVLTQKLQQRSSDRSETGYLGMSVGTAQSAPKETLAALLDYLIGASEERLRQVEVKHLRGLQIAVSSARSVVGT